MRKRLCIAIMALFILGICTGLACAKDNGKADPKGNGNKITVRISNQEFGDMEGEWSREAVFEAQLEGFVNGDENHMFNPNKSLTNLEAIAMLLNASGIDFDTWEPDDDTVTFFEENEGLIKKIPAWGQKYFMAAYEEGLFSDDETVLENELKAFNPNQGIKRYEVCRFIERMDAVEDYNTGIFADKNEFEDADEMTDEDSAIVEELKGKGIINGYPDGYFYPNRVLKRCEMVVILGNMEENVLHRFASSKVIGTLTEVSEADADGAYVITVDSGDDTVDIDANDDTRVFLDGEEVDIEDIIDSRVKVFVKNDIALLVRVIPEATEEESETEEVETDRVAGTLTDVDIASDEDLDYVLTVETDDGDVEVNVNEDTVIKYDGAKITIDDLEAFEAYEGLEVQASIEDDLAVTVKILPAEEEE